MKKAIIALLSAITALTIAQSGPLGNLAQAQEGQSRRATSSFREGKDGKYDSKAFPKGDLEEKSNWDNFRVQPGQTHVLMDEQGPGVITHIWMTFLGPEPQGWAPKGSANHQEMLLRIYWDGNPKPAVEAPIGDFFANSFGKRSSVVSLPVIVEDADSYNCFWNMPFRKSARVEIVNQSDKPINLLYYNIDWIKKKSIPADTPYFYAQYRQEYPVQHGKDYTILETTGKGHYVGTVLSVRTRSPSWFGEGDEKIYVNGEKHPSIWGTGTEDYFLSAWGLKTTSTPYFGVPYFDQWGIVGGHTSAYRWHINDPIVFERGIKITFEHFGWMSPDENPDYKTNSWNEREDDYSSVAFWYQTGASTFTARAPSGPERKLPSLERVISYARDFTDAKYHGVGNVTTQQLDLYDGPQLLYMPPKEVVERTKNPPPLNDRGGRAKDEGVDSFKPNGQTPNANSAWLEIPITVTKKEPLRLVLNMTTSYDFGQYQTYLIGPMTTQFRRTPVQLGNAIELYSKDVANTEVHLLDFWPEPGTYILRLECVGKNPFSTGYYLGIESVRLRERRPRVLKFGHDKDKDWRKTPTLYG